MITEKQKFDLEFSKVIPALESQNTHCSWKIW